MNPIIENLTGTGALTDQVIASDLLVAAKSGVRNCAIAITEAASPDVREVLRRQLEDAVEMHGQIATYMMSRGWYNAYDISKQIDMDLTNAETALNLQ